MFTIVNKNAEYSKNMFTMVNNIFLFYKNQLITNLFTIVYIKR